MSDLWYPCCDEPECEENEPELSPNCDECVDATPRQFQLLAFGWADGTCDVNQKPCLGWLWNLTWYSGQGGQGYWYVTHKGGCKWRGVTKPFCENGTAVTGYIEIEIVQLAGQRKGLLRLIDVDVNGAETVLHEEESHTFWQTQCFDGENNGTTVGEWTIPKNTDPCGNPNLAEVRVKLLTICDYVAEAACSMCQEFTTPDRHLVEITGFDGQYDILNGTWDLRNDLTHELPNGLKPWIQRAPCMYISEQIGLSCETPPHPNGLVLILQFVREQWTNDPMVILGYIGLSGQFPAWPITHHQFVHRFDEDELPLHCVNDVNALTLNYLDLPPPPSECSAPSTMAPEATIL